MSPLSESLIAEKVLLFIPVSDWGTNPFLVNSKWHQIFISEEFAELYWVHLFKLSTNEKQLLKKTINNFASEFNKKDDKMIVPYTTYWSMLKEYAKLQTISQHFLEHGCLTSEHANTLEMVEEREQTRHAMKESLRFLFSNPMTVNDEPVSEFEIQKILRGPCKELFVTFVRISEDQSESEYERIVECIIYLDYGFPVHLKCSFYSKYHRDFDEKQSVDFFGNHLFTGEYGRKEKSNEKVLSLIREQVFHMDDDYNVESLDSIKLFNTLLYNWFAVGFLCTLDDNILTERLKDLYDEENEEGNFYWNFDRISNKKIKFTKTPKRKTKDEEEPKKKKKK